MKLDKKFFEQDVLIVAKLLIGKLIVRVFDDGTIIRTRIIETEAYNGIEDEACHAFKGKTARTKVMFDEGGLIYVYLIYGLHYLFNIVTGQAGNPQAVLIRGSVDYKKPAVLSKNLQIDKTFYGIDITLSEKVWIEDDGFKADIKTGKRIGIDYAGEKWINMPWRFILDDSSL